MHQSKVAGPVFILSMVCLLPPANADPFSFNTGSVTNFMASASRPQSTGKIEIESADDFVTTAPQTTLTSATFTGLITGGATATIGPVTVEIYRVFPNDSNVARTPQVPTRVNSPSDVELLDRSTTSGNLSFTTTVLNPTFTALNSVQPGGISLKTGGNGAVTGQEVQFSVTFTVPIGLLPDHYFFVPQVEIDTPPGVDGEFLWLSGTRPNATFPTGFTDLQSWTRDQPLDPDWLRIGTDIVDGSAPVPTFNAAFSLSGVAVPLPGTLPLFATGLGALGLLGWRKKRKAQAV